MSKWTFKAREDGRMEFPNDSVRISFTDDMKANPGVRYEVKRLMPESRHQRSFYEGAVICLWMWLDGKDHHDSRLHKKYHELANEEFNGEVEFIADKPVRVGKSSSGKLHEIVDKVIDFLEEQYGIKRQDCLDPEDYKKFIDEIFMDGKYEDYIEYLCDKGVLKRRRQKRKW